MTDTGGSDVPARNIDHDSVRNALVKDGWTITADPYHMRWGGKNLFVDLAAERILTAEKEGRRIAVEVQSFLGPSDVTDLQEALGQFLLYRTVMEKTDPDRILYLAVGGEAYRDIFTDPLGQLARESLNVLLIVFDPTTEVIKQWIP